LEFGCGKSCGKVGKDRDLLGERLWKSRGEGVFGGEGREFGEESGWLWVGIRRVLREKRGL
jgi:hypothetical protein